LKQVLYLSYDGLTDPLGQSQVLPYIKGLASNGRSFTVISFEKNKASYSYQEIFNSISSSNIDWIPISYTKQPPILSTIWDVYKLKQKVKNLIRNRKVDVIHCRSYITSLVGLEMKKKHNIPFIFDMRGFWADERVDGGIWNLKNPVFRLVYNFFKKKELEFCKNADAIISLTYAGINEMKTWNVSGILAKTHIIPCAVDTDLFSQSKIIEKEAEELKKQIFPLGSKVLLYSGSLGTWYLLKEMLIFFEKLEENDASWYFLFLTRDTENLQAELKNLSPEKRMKIKFLEVKRNEIPRYITMADFTIFFIVPKFSKKSSFPTKHAEFMAMGKPSIANSNVGDVEAIINDSKSGVVLNSFSEAEIENKVLEMLNFNGNNHEISEFAEKQFSLSSAVAKYQSIYSSILREK
jgi:glycosyltransferase involved in cell wall biosynthesis